MTSPKGAVLVVFPFCLDHVGHGNIQRILGIARHVVAQGFDVDLVYQGNPQVPPAGAAYAPFRRVYAVEGGVRASEEEACRRRLMAFYSGHELPAAHLRPSAALTTLVRSLLEAEAYRAVIATYAFTAPIFAGLGRHVLTICDVQDIMHEHAGACARATGQTTTFSLPASTEEFLWRQWDVLIAITPEDEARIGRDLLPQQHLLLARHAAEVLAAAPDVGTDDVALYAASDNVSNVQAVSWLLQQVWPRVMAARPTARLRIAGLICRALPASASQVAGVEILGFRQDLGDEFAGCGVLVAPYLYGSGLKIKVVEAACGGKACVTTAAGLVGTDLEAGRAIEAHDDPARFAEALAGLLADRSRREAIATAALVQARQLFSPDACYWGIVCAIELFTTGTAAPKGAGVDPSIVNRIQIVVDQIHPDRVIVWGNGSHTRSLMAALADTPVRVSLIADGRATDAGTSPEGIAVVPSSRLVLAPDDLIVLSSETFEPEMWRDLATYRGSGGYVLGLADAKLVSRSLLGRLSASTKAELGVDVCLTRRTDAAGTNILWDSQGRSSRWWRLCVLKDLAAGVVRRGDQALIVTHASLATDAAAIGDLSAAAPVAPILELDGRALEQGGHDGGPRGVSCLSGLLAATTARAAALLAWRADDTLTLVSPTLSECFGVARTLAAFKGRCPALVIYALPPFADGSHWLGLPDGDHRAYWRLAVSALADAVDDRLSVVAADGDCADRLGALLGRPVGVLSYPAACSWENGLAPVPRVVCLGHVGAPGVRPLLESIVATCPGEIAWRSDQGDGRPGTDARWAQGLASLLGVALLDDRTPSSMRHAITAADAVVVLGGATREGWHEAAAEYAASAAVPVLEPDVVLNESLRRILNESTR